MCPSSAPRNSVGLHRLRVPAFFFKVRGESLKIRFKILAALVLAALLPAIIVCSVSVSKMKTDNFDYMQRSLFYTIKNQVEDISSYASEITNTVKRIAINEDIVNYTMEANKSGNELSAESPLYAEVMRDIKYLTENNAVIEAMLLNDSGIVIASTGKENTIGKKIPNYKDLLESAVINSGVSGFFMSDANQKNSPVFNLCKVVYSPSNEKIGLLYITYDTQILQKYINNIKTDKYTIVAVLDGSGNVLEYPFKTINHYSNSKNYSIYTEQLNYMYRNPESTSLNDNLVYDNTKKRCYYASPIPGTGWYLIASADIIGIQNFSKSSGTEVTMLMIFLCIAVITGAFFASGYFVKPVKLMLKAISEKKKGNNNARFDESSKDEFSIVGHEFNKMLDSLGESEQRYRTIVEMTNNITFEVNYKKDTVFVSKNFNKKFSFRPKDDTLKESFIYKVRVHKDDKDKYLNDMDRILGPTANFIQGEYRIKSIYGDFIWVMIKATKFFDREEKPSKIIGVIVDIDREKKSEMHLLQRANYDNLTQLYNRESFLKAVTEQLSASLYKKTLDAVMFIDLDDFKYFNDEFGHACGDEVLKFVADTLKEITFERGFAGRFGGDEFVACVTGFALFGDAGKVAQEIIDILGNGFISDSTGQRLYIKCSIGIAFLHESGKTTNEVIAAADEAMYNIKKHGKSSYAYAKSASKNSKIPDVVAPTTSSIDSDRQNPGSGSSSRYKNEIEASPIDSDSNDKKEESKPTIEVDDNFFNPLY